MNSLLLYEAEKLKRGASCTKEMHTNLFSTKKSLKERGIDMIKVGSKVKTVVKKKRHKWGKKVKPKFGEVVYENPYYIMVQFAKYRECFLKTDLQSEAPPIVKI